VVNYTVSAAAGTLTVTMSGGTGDADLYVRRGSAPTTSTYTCRPYLTGNNETCTINVSSAATYYIQIRGYTAYSNVALKAVQ
jgi:pseudolysin/vibriolysin